jgi:hypothetical protein
VAQDGVADAYKKGRAFEGQLEKHFIVLNDHHRETPVYPSLVVLQAKKATIGRPGCLVRQKH